MTKEVKLTYDPTKGKRTLPDVDYISNTVLLILEQMNTSEMKTLKQNDYESWHNKLEDDHKDFVDQYTAIFDVVISGKDLTPLYYMLETIGNVKSGKITEANMDQHIVSYLQSNYIKKI